MSTEQAFPEVSDTVIDHARGQALKALQDSGTPKRVAQFYNPETNYAGATFAQLEPRDQTAVTAADLLATTTLSVDIPPRAIRRFLEDPDTSSHLSTALSGLPSSGLEETTVEDFGAMCSFYDLVKESLARAGTKTSNPWVTASKITARKRPDLFPVRDSVVCKFLGINRLGDRAKDWMVFRSLLRDEEVTTRLDQLPELTQNEHPSGTLPLDSQRLRLLDAVLWRYAGETAY